MSRVRTDLSRCPRHTAVALGFALLTARVPAHAQNRDVELRGGASAIGLLTHDTNTPGARTLSEAYLTQPVLMGVLRGRSFSALGTLNLEGLTLRRGELDLGEWGEGYVDRRHPHAYIHELIIGAVSDQRFGDFSLFAGRGFVSFGSDDPMVRPFESYPVDHHLAQILERLVAIGAARMGPIIAEASTFNGDEPVDPSTAPRFDRFGDSWALRGTLLGDRVAHALFGAELSASYAAVKSPEYREGRGLDQRKAHAALRLTADGESLSRYALIEVARTTDVDRGQALYSFDAVLAEGALCRSDVGLALRWERSDRPEEERLIDLFRSPRPATDVSILGVTEWTTLTAAVRLATLETRFARAAPFLEIARLTADRTTAALFDPMRLYGATAMWRVTAGLRVRAGHEHGRMGRYGAAEVPSLSEPHQHGSHSMVSHGCFS